MNEQCKDCIQVKNLEEKIKGLWHQIEESKEQRKDFEKRIVELEKNSDVTKEKFDRLFNAIECIEKNIEKIAESIQAIQTKGAKTYDNLKYEAVKYIIMAAIGFLIAKFVK